MPPLLQAILNSELNFLFAVGISQNIQISQFIFLIVL